MSTTVVVIAGCTAVTVAIKSAGPIALGGRELPLALASVIVLLSSALLSALVVTSALADGDQLAVGADTAGVAVGGGLALAGRSIVLCVIAAALATAGLRALSA